MADDKMASEKSAEQGSGGSQKGTDKGESTKSWFDKTMEFLGGGILVTLVVYFLIAIIARPIWIASELGYLGSPTKPAGLTCGPSQLATLTGNHRLTWLRQGEKSASYNLDTFEGRARKLLAENPLIDGHNDLPVVLRFAYGNRVNSPEFREHFEHGGMSLHVDLPRMDEGQYGGAFWIAYAPCPADPLALSTEELIPTVQFTLEQLDVLARLGDAYPHYFPATLSAAAAEANFAAGRLVSPLGIEGLHQIANSFATLRRYFALGVRYATLTHNCHNRFADAAVLVYANGTARGYASHWGGLSLRGQQLVREMNRLGMIVDLAHVSPETMRDVLVGDHPSPRRPDDVRDTKHCLRAEWARSDAPAHERDVPEWPEWTGSLAPPIISHSSAFALCPHPRNVPDDVLKLVRLRGGLVMVNFSPDFISCKAPFDHHMPTTDDAHATLARVADHIMYIGTLVGFEHVGIGSDFDGIPSLPRGIDGVGQLPLLVAELLRRGLSDRDAANVVGRNLLRVWARVDAVAKDLQASGYQPAEDLIPLDLDSELLGA